MRANAVTYTTKADEDEDDAGKQRCHPDLVNGVLMQAQSKTDITSVVGPPKLAPRAATTRIRVVMSVNGGEHRRCIAPGIRYLALNGLR